MFRTAPLLLVATCLVVAAVAPFVTTASVLDPVADLFAVVALLTLGTVALALAGIDTGTAFGGMGASREMTIVALVEPTLLVAIFALSVPVGSTNLGAIVTATLDDPAQVFSPVSLLAAVALVVVIIAETGRLPVDNPSTHLELTMVHEAMILEYSGPDLAMVELASSMRLTVFLGLLANLFVPWGIATTGQPLLVAAAVARVRRQGRRCSGRCWRRRGLPGQAAAVPGARTARRFVRPGVARRRRFLLPRLMHHQGSGSDH